MAQIYTLEHLPPLLLKIRYAGMVRFGDPRGYIHKRGRYHSFTKKGPGRRHKQGAYTAEDVAKVKKILDGLGVSQARQQGIPSLA